MNEDLTEKKINNCLKKKVIQTVSPKKNNSCTNGEQNKKIPCKLKIPLPLTFLMVRPLQE